MGCDSSLDQLGVEVEQMTLKKVATHSTCLGRLQYRGHVNAFEQPTLTRGHSVQHEKTQ